MVTTVSADKMVENFQFWKQIIKENEKSNLKMRISEKEYFLAVHAPSLLFQKMFRS